MNFQKASLNLQLSLGHSNSGSRWRLEINDEVSGLRLLTLTLTPEEFGKALGACYTTKLTGEVPSPDLYAARVGKRMDVKTVNVPIGATYGIEATVAAAEAVKPLLVNGWEVDDLRDYNHHRRGGSSNEGTYSVTLSRWVDPSTPKEPEPEKPAKPAKPAKKPKSKK